VTEKRPTHPYVSLVVVMGLAFAAYAGAAAQVGIPLADAPSSLIYDIRYNFAR
jgi:hypothetical protein